MLQSWYKREEERCGFPNRLMPDLLSLPTVLNVETWEKEGKQKDASSVEDQETYHQDICRSVCQYRNKKDVNVLLALAIDSGHALECHAVGISVTPLAEVGTVGREGCGLGKCRNKCFIFFSSDMTFQSIGIFIYHPTL